MWRMNGCEARTLGAAALVLLAGAACADHGLGPTAVDDPVAERFVATGAPTTRAWHRAAREAIARNRAGAQPAARALALVSLAEYAAVLNVGGGGRARFEAERGAIAATSAAVLSYLFPTDAERFERMLAKERDHGPGRPHPFFARGERVGREVAERVIARARGDGFGAVWSGTVPVGPGLWTGISPVAPLLGQMRPFLLERGSQFRPDAPPEFGSPEYLTALAEVRRISDARTEEQSRSAGYWALSPGTVTTQGWWDETAAGLVARHELDEVAAARTFALLNMAAMDALISCFDAKYTYWLIRPSHADAAITTPIGLPNHPSYPSAHACLSGASAEILRALFPTDGARLSELDEAGGLSRVYAGIHYRFDVEVGRTLGVSVARYALEIDRERGLLAPLADAAQ